MSPQTVVQLHQPVVRLLYTEVFTHVHQQGQKSKMMRRRFESQATTENASEQIGTIATLKFEELSCNTATSVLFNLSQFDFADPKHPAQCG